MKSIRCGSSACWEPSAAHLTSVDQSKATRERYLAYLRGVVTARGLNVKTFTRVRSIVRNGDGFELLTVPASLSAASASREAERDASRSCWRARRVVLAIGNMHRPRLLDVPGEELPHVSHYFCDPHLCFGQQVLVVGGKNSAVEAAIRMQRVGAHVTISYRGDSFDSRRVKYWLKPELDWLIKHGRVRFHPRTVVRSITTQSVELGSCDPDAPATAERRSSSAGTSGAITSVQVDRVFLLTGYEQDPSLLESIGVALVGEERAPQHDPGTMETTIPGIFVAGTAAAGSQRRTRVYIETSHVHVDRIVRALTGRALPWIRAEDRDQYASLEES